MRLLFTFLLLSLEAQSLSLSLSLFVLPNQSRQSNQTLCKALSTHSLSPWNKSTLSLSLSLCYTPARTHYHTYTHVLHTLHASLSTSVYLWLPLHALAQGERRERERKDRAFWLFSTWVSQTEGSFLLGLFHLSDAKSVFVFSSKSLRVGFVKFAISLKKPTASHR